MVYYYYYYAFYTFKKLYLLIFENRLCGTTNMHEYVKKTGNGIIERIFNIFKDFEGYLIIILIIIARKLIIIVMIIVVFVIVKSL